MMAIALQAMTAVLWRLGGWSRARWSGFRDVLIPVLLFLYYGFSMGLWIGFLTAGAANTIRIGYGAYDPEHDDKPSWLAKITKDREGWLIRGIYGAITSFGVGLFPCGAHILAGEYIYIIKFVFYIAFNVALEVTLNKARAGDTVTELGNGAGRGLIFYLCR